MDGKQKSLIGLPKRPIEIRPIQVQRRRAWLAIVCLLASIGLGCTYLWTMLESPIRYPLVVLSSTYSPPWELNPWAAENVDLLSQLDGHNISLIAGGDGLDIGNGKWADFDEKVRSAMPKDTSIPLLFYINFHAAVNDQGEASFILDNASEGDSHTWVTAWELLQHLDQAIDDTRSLVLLLEIGRQHGMWPETSGNREFCNSLERMLAERGDSFGFSNIHIIASSHDSYGTASDWQGHCDPFTREIARGLHGAADTPSEGGNGDRFVDVEELSAFVTRRIADWSSVHRGIQQNVWTWNRDEPTTRLTWKLSRPFQLPSSAEIDNTQRDTVRQIWEAMAELQSAEPWHKFPGKWRELCRNALSYEQAVFGGNAARKRGPVLEHAVKQRIDWLKQRVMASDARLTTAERIPVAQSLSWRQFAKSPTLDTAKALRDDAESISPDQACEVPFLCLLAEDPDNLCWEHPDQLSRYATLRSTRLSAHRNIPIQVPMLVELAEELRLSELSIEDAILAHAEPKNWLALLDAYATRMNQFHDLLGQFEQQVTSLEMLMSELPELGTSLLESNLGNREEFFQTEDQLNLLTLNASRNLQVMGNPSSSDDVYGLPDLTSTMSELQRQQSEMWMSLLGANIRGTPEKLYQLERLIASTWFPISLNEEAQIGILRLKARTRLSTWENELAEFKTEGLASPDSEGLADDVQQVNDYARAEFARYFVARMAGISQTSSLTPVEIRALLRRAERNTVWKSAEVPAWSKSNPTEMAAIEARLAAGIAVIPAADQVVEQWHNQRRFQRSIAFAESVLDDFWAIPKQDGVAYFERIAKASLADAKELAEKSTMGTPLTKPGLGNVPVDSMPVDSMPVDSMPVDSMPVDSMNDVNRVEGGTLISTMGPNSSSPPTFHGLQDQSSSGRASSQTETELNRKQEPPRLSESLPNLNSTITSDGSWLERFQALLRNRAEAADDAFLSDAMWVPDLSAATHGGAMRPDWISQIAVKRNASFVTVPEGAVPEGTAAVMVSDGMHSARVPQTIDGDFEQAHVPLSVKWIGNREESRPSDVSDQRIFAGLMFRGHRFGSLLPRSPTLGREATAEFESGPTTITVVDNAPGERRRTFVLDCSASMYGPTESEQAADDEPNYSPLNKLEAAKLALLRMLSQLQDAGDQVSVILYGHRVSQGTAEQGKLRQTRYHSKFPFSMSLKAYEDVETILPSGRFGSAELSIVAERLEQVLPWGQTPLYLAISHAMDLPPQIGPTLPHDIVVISDGRNYQFNPAEESRVSVDEVVAKANRNATSVHVIGFGVPPQEAEESEKQYQALATATGGSVTMQIADASLLVSQLSKLSEPSEFQVRLADASTQIGQVNQALHLPELRGLYEPVAIEYAGQTYFINLTRGASLRLHVNAMSNLAVLPYLVDSPRFAKLFDPQDRPLPIELGVHQPKWDADRIRWKLSVQSTDGQVIRWPSEIVVEVEPISSGDEVKRYRPFLICDAAWSAGYTVPVLEFETSDWPLDAAIAKISIWMRDVSAEPIASQIVAEPEGTWQPVDSIALTWETDAAGFSAMIVGEFDEPAANWVPKVIGRVGDNVARRVSDEQNVSFHRYGFKKVPKNQILDLVDSSPSAALRIDLHSLSNLKRDAAHLSEPIVVELVRPVPTLTPSAPAATLP